MKQKLVLGLVVAIFLFSIVAVQPVMADPHQHFEFNVSAYSYQYASGYAVEGCGGYGTFTVHYDDITFFICDQYNFDRYVDGQSHVTHCYLEDVVDGDYKFRYPHADTWYLVFCNKDSIWAKDVTLDVYQDLTSPVITLNLDTGATYSGIKEIRVTASDVSFSVWRIQLQEYRSESGNWYTFRTEYYTDSLIYNWDTKCWVNGDVRWRVVAEDTVNNEAIKEVLVTVYNYVAPTTTTDDTTTDSTTGETTQPTTTKRTTTSEPIPNPMDAFIRLCVMFGLPLILVVGIVYAVAKRGRKKEDAVEVVSEQVISKDAKVFVICPYCGAKTEQGIMKCRNCGADL